MLGKASLRLRDPKQRAVHLLDSARQQILIQQQEIFRLRTENEQLKRKLTNHDSAPSVRPVIQTAMLSSSPATQKYVLGKAVASSESLKSDDSERDVLGDSGDRLLRGSPIRANATETASQAGLATNVNMRDNLSIYSGEDETPQTPASHLIQRTSTIGLLRNPVKAQHNIIADNHLAYIPVDDDDSLPHLHPNVESTKLQEQQRQRIVQRQPVVQSLLQSRKQSLLAQGAPYREKASAALREQISSPVVQQQSLLAMGLNSPSATALISCGSVALVAASEQLDSLSNKPAWVTERLTPKRPAIRSGNTPSRFLVKQSPTLWQSAAERT